MPIRVHLLAIELRLAGTLVAETLLLNPVFLVTIFYLPGYLVFLHFVEGGIYVKPIAAFMLVLLLVLGWKKLRLGSDEPTHDEPVRARVEDHPELARLLARIKTDIAAKLPARVNFVLSPLIWRVFGCDAAKLRENTRELTIPIGCLQIWSVFDFSCYISHTVLWRRPPRLLFGPARASLERLTCSQYQIAAQRISNWRTRMVERFANRYRDLLCAWHLLADMEADRRVADVYGAPTVAEWLQRTSLADVSVPACLVGMIEPAAGRGQLLPIAESCKAYHHQIESYWVDALSSQMSAVERGATDAQIHTVIFRLAALQRHPRSQHSHDPRPASALFENLPEIEQAVLRNELGESMPELNRVGVSSIGALVLLPQMEEEVARNAELLRDCSVADIPDLVRDIPRLASLYREEPHYLLADSQRELMMPQVLAAFLATALVREGWSVLYSLEKGLQLRRGTGCISPDEVIRQLMAAELPADEFRAMVNNKNLAD